MTILLMPDAAQNNTDALAVTALVTELVIFSVGIPSGGFVAVVIRIVDISLGR